MVGRLRSYARGRLDRRSRRAVGRVLSERLTYLERDALLDLARLVREIEHAALPASSSRRAARSGVRRS
jgi:hypothetical protein